MDRVLIVPYGIETRQVGAGELRPRVLIVPYGIETLLPKPVRKKTDVLIVPYGIETPIRVRIARFIVLSFLAWHRLRR